MQVTCYLDVRSSWCLGAEPTWTKLRARYAGQAEFGWKIALMTPSDFPASREQCDWFYRRSGCTAMRAPFMLTSGWLEIDRKGDYRAPNLVAEAGRELGIADDTVWLALSRAAMRLGRKIGDLNEAIAVAVDAAKLDAAKLRACASSAEVKARVEASTAEFHAHKIDQRPAFIFKDTIGDKAVFSGLVGFEPLAATIDAMLADTAAYAAHAAHYGNPPTS